MTWRSRKGQAIAEAALVIPLLLLLLLGIITFGYGGLAQLLVVTSASQGARLGAAMCGESQPPDVVLSSTRQRALTVLSPLAGPKDAGASFDGSDLVVTSTFDYTPPLPGTRAIFGSNSLHYQYTARYRCY